MPDHSRSALLLRSFGDRWTAFLVTDSFIPDQATLSMSYGSDGLIMFQPRDGAVIHDLEDAVFGSGYRIGGLIEKEQIRDQAGQLDVGLFQQRLQLVLLPHPIARQLILSSHSPHESR